MRLEIKSVWARWVVIALGIVVCLAAVAWIAKTYAAHGLSQKTTLKNLQLAVRLDPGNSEFHWQLGRLYQYNPTDVQPEEAIAEFRRAIQLSPYDPRPWMDLGAALEFQGKLTEAGQCLQRADALVPNLPSYQWPIANFYLLQGDVDEAFRHFKKVLAGTPNYDQIVFSTAWKASGDAHQILEDLIPHNVTTEFSYLSFLLTQKRFTEAEGVWDRLMNGSEKFTAQQSAGYLDALLAARRPADAYRVWMDLAKKGLVNSSASGQDQNLLNNGDFEDELLNLGFGWRIIATPDVYAGVDQGTFRSPNHSLLVQFGGNQNLYYRQAFQYVKVTPDQSYHLEGFVKTDSITTDSGPRLEVYDPYDPAALDKFSEDLTGSTPTWTPLTIVFKTGPRTELIVVALARVPTRKLDNQFTGKVWLDDVRLTFQTE
ncbi:MAG: tetratricopeptide repeat protein [Acidobacteriia bacterium]|nr:tetratricopeptide repeat protein [Terriglobia bacterium]